MGMSRFKLIILAVAAEGVVFMIALILGRFFDINFLPLTRNFLRDILIGTIGASLPFALFVLTLTARAEKIPILGSLRKTMITDVKSIFSNTCFLDIILISLIAGFAEEFLFRGVIQAKFGIIIASILFGLVHFVTPAYVVVASFIGFYIGFFYLVFEGLLIPIQLHFIYDLAALLYLKHTNM